jgi:hypothetical protein
MASQNRHKGRQPFEDLSFSKTSPFINQENQGKGVILWRSSNLKSQIFLEVHICFAAVAIYPVYVSKTTASVLLCF